MRTLTCAGQRLNRQGRWGSGCLICDAPGCDGTQFVTAKTTSLKKTIVGLTPIRESDVQSKAMTDLAPKLGGLVEFYRGPARVAWTPTGKNVPDYPKLAQLWWKNVALKGETISYDKLLQAWKDGKVR